MLNNQRRQAIKEEKKQLLTNKVFLDEVENMYKKVLNENPDVIFAIDLSESHNSYMQKEWKTVNKEKLKQYRQKKCFNYNKKNYCDLCGAVIMNTSTWCKLCFMQFVIPFKKEILRYCRICDKKDITYCKECFREKVKLDENQRIKINKIFREEKNDKE